MIKQNATLQLPSHIVIYNVMIYFDILVDKNTSITDIAGTSVRFIVTELIINNISTYMYFKCSFGKIKTTKQKQNEKNNNKKRKVK